MVKTSMNTDPHKYIIGTRGSLLALTQCQQIKEELEKLTPDHFELKIIKTEGDLNTDQPLWQMPGKDFFTKELDQALHNGKIDLVVHSYKDLGSDRPPEIQLAAITERFYSADILLIKKQTVEKLSQKDHFTVGTSSPRRKANLESSLAEFLPHGEKLKIQTKVLRGNVNTRIEKLNRGEYDAIVLALPGIDRLAKAASSRKILKALSEDLTFMILPQSHFPSAASQGALAIECLKNRKDNGLLLSKLKKMEDPKTVKVVSRERQDFQNYGGGCHLAVGIQVESIHNSLYIVHKGELDGKPITKVEYQRERLPFQGSQVFIGLPAKQSFIDQSKKVPEVKDDFTIKSPYKASLPQEPSHLLVASRYGTMSLDRTKIHYLWSSGAATMKNLAKEGYWIHGSADGLGENQWLSYLQSDAIKLMTGEECPRLILTHPDSTSSSEKVVGCYHRDVRPLEQISPEYHQQLQNCAVFYWTSYPQYQAFLQAFPFIKNKIHAVGPGKTYMAFKEQNIKVELFASMDDFRTWIGQHELKKDTNGD